MIHISFFLFYFITKNDFNLNTEFGQIGLYDNFIVQANHVQADLDALIDTHVKIDYYKN